MSTYSRPVRGGRVSQGWGRANSRYAAGRHTGIDYSVPVGTAVYATAPGRVISAGYAGAYGLQIRIAHAGKVYSLYGHLSRTSVRVGSTVWSGQRIGSSGNTGNSSGPHLHFEVRKGVDRYGRDVNPGSYLGKVGYSGAIPSGGGSSAGGSGSRGHNVSTRIDRALREAGFSGNSYRIAYAIMMAESGGNPGAYNGNSRTGDKSYGLFQINMLGAMGPERRRAYGLGSNDALFDPMTNAKVAWQMSRHGTNWTPWSTYKNGTYRKFLGGGSFTAPPQETTTVSQKKYTWETKAAETPFTATSEVSSPVAYANPVDTVAGTVGAAGTYLDPVPTEEELV